MKVNYLRSVHNIKFIVKEDERIVIAMVEKNNGRVGVPTKLIEALKLEDEDAYSIAKRMQKYNYSNVVGLMRGIARCDEKDEFDVDTGKKIAFLKLRRKYNKYLAKILTHQANVYLHKINTIKEALDEVSSISIGDTMNLRKYGTAADEVYPN